MKKKLAIIASRIILVIIGVGLSTASQQEKLVKAVQTSSEIQQSEGTQIVSSSYWDDMKMTYYSYHDNQEGNSGKYGAYTIANPIIHQNANDRMGGDGSYRNPIIVAAPIHFLNRQWQYGTRIYSPHLKKYLIVEDECDTLECRNHKMIDVWMYSTSKNDSRKVEECQKHWTSTGFKDHSWKVIINPPSNLTVDTRPFFYSQTQQCRKHPNWR